MGRLTSFVRAHPLATTALTLVATLVGVGTWVYWTQVRVPYVEVSFLVPTAPELAPSGPDQTVYRIDASRSSVSYDVTETLAGGDRTAVGTTHGIAGDVLVDAADLSASEVGRVVVNVAQLTSDQELRDQRLQHDFLQSKDFPLATFDTTSIDGLPATVEPGVAYDVTLTGDLTVKDITAPTTLSGTATVDGEELSLQATTTVLLSTYDAGPIRLAGFVSTGDEAVLTFDVVAVDTRSAEVPGAVVAPEREVAVGEGPSFAAEIQPVLSSSCASCHEPDGVGAIYWELETAADAVDIAPGLGLVVGAGYMPPWHATSVGIPLRHDPRLTQDQIDAVVAWADAGGPLDVDPATPVVADEVDAPEVAHDIVVPMPEPYDGTEEVDNDYRCFVLDPGFTDTTWLQGYEFLPDQVRIVHHATAFRALASQQTELEARDAADPGPGWSCTTGTGADAQFLAWAPGQDPTVFPEGSAMRFEAGDTIVVQMHYHFSHTAPPDASSVAFELADGDEGSLDEVFFDVYLAPAEIPCRDDQSGPLCDRDAVRAEIAEDYGPSAAFIGDALMRVCGAELEDFADMTDGRASASCEYRPNSTGELLAIMGHMHERGDTFRMTLNPGRPDEQVLLDIATWDFSWQRNYLPAESIVLERDDVLRMECSWDRDRKPQLEPRYITWAEGTEDEMCYATVTVRSFDD